MVKKMNMMFPLLIGGLFLLLIFSLAKKKISLILNFGLRAVFGFLGVYVINACLQFLEIEVAVGFNPATFLTLGTLGFSGFFLLYGIMFGKFL